MSDLYREFRLVGEGPVRALWSFIKGNVHAFIEQQSPLRVIVTNEERPRTYEQNKRYWQILTIIAEQAWVNGQQFKKEVWHEFFAKTYLPMKEFVLPDGEIILRRTSTSELGVKAFTQYMNEVEYYASMELGVEFHYREAA